jgi:hypothetical protein
MGTREQPASPVNLMAISKSSVKFDPKLLSAPVMHAFLITNELNIKENPQIITDISRNPAKIKDTLYSSIDLGTKYESQVNSIYRKIDFINYHIDRMSMSRNFVLRMYESVTGKEMNMREMEIDRNTVSVLLPEIEDLISEIKLSHRTPRGYIQRVIGIGGNGSTRFTNIAGVVGYKGVYVHMNNPEMILNTRDQKIATLGALLQTYRLLRNYGEGKLNEHDVIMASFLIDTMLGMGIDVTSIHDVVQLIPMWNKWRMSPSIFSVESKEEVCKFFLKFYVLGRYLSMMKATGIDSLIRETSWQFTGNNEPGQALIESCFQGIYKGESPGMRQYWLWPASSADLKAGYFQIMGDSPTNRNYWYPVPEPNELKIRATPVYVEYEYIIMPNLIDEGYDVAILALEPSARTAERREFYHKESNPPTLIVQGRYLDSGVSCSHTDLVETLVTGGQPMYGGNLLLRPYYELFKLSQVSQMDNIEVVEADRYDSIHKAIKIGEDFSRESANLYKGASGDPNFARTMFRPWNRRSPYCPICDKTFSRMQDLKAHFTKEAKAGDSAHQSQNWEDWFTDGE